MNIEKSLKAFSKAIVYIDADINSSEDARLLASQILYHNGLATFFISNDCLVVNDFENSEKYLNSALKSFEVSIQLNSENLPAQYERAKMLHFLKNDELALEVLCDLFETEKSYALKAVNDKNFETIWPQIEDCIK